MKIGIDIDDTLNNEYQFMIDFGSMWCAKLGKYKLEKIDTIHATEMFGWPQKVSYDFWHKNMDEFAKFPAVPFASEITKQLKKDGHQIYIITARKMNDEFFPKHIASEMKTFTANWLMKNEIAFDKIIFDAKDKGKICKENGIDLMIDDDPFNIDRLIGKTNVFLFDKPYNRKPEYSLLTRVYSWYDAYKKIKDFERKHSGRAI